MCVCALHSSLYRMSLIHSNDGDFSSLLRSRQCANQLGVVPIN